MRTSRRRNGIGASRRSLSARRHETIRAVEGLLGVALRNTMRELELAGIPSMHPTRPRGGGLGQFPLSRAAFIASIAAHVLAGYALSSHLWPGASLPPPPKAEFFLFEMPAPRPPEAVPVTPRPPVEPVPEAREEPAPPPAPAPRPARPVPEPTVVVEPPPAVEPAPSTEPAPRAFIDFDEERRRAVNQVVESRAAEK